MRPARTPGAADGTIGPVVDHLTPVRASATRLRNVLRLNAFSSFVGGGIAAAVPFSVDRLLGSGHPGWVRLVGFGLIGFAVAVGAVGAARTSHLVAFTRLICAADLLWVVASVVTIAAGWYSNAGAITVGGVAAMVGLWAALQVQRVAAVRRHPRMIDADEFPPTETAHAQRVVSVDIPMAWSVITDHEFYGRLAPNLSGVRATTDDGPGLERVCTSRSGAMWHESCTLWHTGSVFEVAVDTGNYPYPLSEMRGSWSVAPAGDGRTTVAMDFRFTPRPGVRGAVLVALMQAAFPIVLRKMLRGWDVEMRRRAGRSSR